MRCATRFRAPMAPSMLVLDNVNLTLVQGQIVGLLGPLRLGQIDAAALIAGLAPPAGGTSPIWASRSKVPRPASPWCSRASRCFPG
jgi:ABC-type lipopolysaccharide export system ATPase subunit